MDPIPGRRIPPPPLPEMVDGEEEWVIDEILDSKVINRKLRYLIKWKDFGLEHNSWEPWDNVNSPELVAEFYRKHPGAARHICATDFFSLPFQPTIVPSRHNSEGGVDVRGHSSVSSVDKSHDIVKPMSRDLTISSLGSNIKSRDSRTPSRDSHALYVPPHRRI